MAIEGGEDAVTSHGAVLEEAVIYYVFSFAMEKPLDIRTAANALLRAEVAETVASPAEDGVRVAPRYGDLVKLRARAISLNDTQKMIKEGRYLAFARKHPFYFAQAVAWAVKSAISRIVGRASHPSEADLAESPAEDVGDEVDNAATVRMIEESVAHAQAANAVQQAIEAQILRPAYLEEEPYLRLTLRDSTHWFAIKDDGVERPKGSFDDGTTCEALLLLHRSGVVQLIFVLEPPRNLIVDEFIAFAAGGGQTISASEICEPVLRNAANKAEKMDKNWLGAWISEVREGTRWRRMEFDEPTSVAQLFGLYRSAIEKIIGVASFPEWQCYPALFINKVACCSDEETWLSGHSRELVSLAGGGVPHTLLRSNVVAKLLPKNSSIRTDDSLYALPSRTVRINWGTEDLDFSEHMWTIVVVENALLQFWQLRALNDRLLASEGDEDVRALQREAIFGLQEVRSSSLMFGTANDIVEELLNGWQASKLQQRIADSLEQLHQLVTAREARGASRRANFFAASAVLAAIAFGLPALSQSLDIVKKLPQDGLFGVIAAPLRAIGNEPGAAAWKAYVVLVAFILLISVSSVARRLFNRRRLRRRPSRLGMEWPHGTWHRRG
jgi:hypothetical protein